MRPQYPFLRCLLVAILLNGLLASCSTESTTEQEATTPTDSVILNDPANNELNSNQSVLLNTILGDGDDGVVRGIVFGDPVSKVKATEKFEMFEDSLSHAGFTYETEQLETIDVLYYFSPKARQVDKITVDVYLNSETATRQLWNSAKRRLTERYGEPAKEISRRIEWKKDPIKASLEEVSVGKDYGLKMVFEPTNKTALASK